MGNQIQRSDQFWVQSLWQDFTRRYIVSARTAFLMSQQSPTSTTQ